MNATGSAILVIAPGLHTDADRVAELEKRIAEAKSAADNSWMLVSSALVLLMTGPGLACYLMVAMVKARFRYDDSLDAFGVHGAGGTIGAILTGIFAVSAVNPIFRDAGGNVLASGLIEGNAHQLVNQLIGVSIAWGLGIAGTLAILFFVDRVVGLRVTQEQENQGLDLSQHGEEGYNWEAS